MSGDIMRTEYRQHVVPVEQVGAQLRLKKLRIRQRRRWSPTRQALSLHRVDKWLLRAARRLGALPVGETMQVHHEDYTTGQQWLMLRVRCLRDADGSLRARFGDSLRVSGTAFAFMEPVA